MEHHGKCRHSTMSRDITHKSRSQGLEEIPDSESKVRTDCGSLRYCMRENLVDHTDLESGLEH